MQSSYREHNVQHITNGGTSQKIVVGTRRKDTCPGQTACRKHQSMYLQHWGMKKDKRCLLRKEEHLATAQCACAPVTPIPPTRPLEL